MRLKEDSWLLTRHIAHRGLWGDGVPENSLTAYARAIEKGYAIEIDLYLSKDGVLFSIHDSKLLRLCGVDRFVFDMTAEEIKKLRISGTDEQIPTFDEVLELVDGKIPLLIEIKDQPSKLIVENIVGYVTLQRNLLLSTNRLTVLYELLETLFALSDAIAVKIYSPSSSL